LGEYLGSCGELSLCNVFRGWWYYTQELQYTYAQQAWAVSGLEQAQEDGLILAFASFTVELSPREDEDITPHEDQDAEEVGPPCAIWPDTDDGF